MIGVVEIFLLYIRSNKIFPGIQELRKKCKRGEAGVRVQANRGGRGNWGAVEGC